MDAAIKQNLLKGGGGVEVEVGELALDMQGESLWKRLLVQTLVAIATAI